MTTNNKEVIEEILGYKITLGNTIKSIRLCMDMSQEEFGKLLGISKQYLSFIENDKKNISIHQSMQFATKLGRVPDSFVEYVLEKQLLDAGLDLRVEVKNRSKRKKAG